MHGPNLPAIAHMLSLSREGISAIAEQYTGIPSIHIQWLVFCCACQKRTRRKKKEQYNKTEMIMFGFLDFVKV